MFVKLLKELTLKKLREGNGWWGGADEGGFGQPGAFTIGPQKKNSTPLISHIHTDAYTQPPQKHKTNKISTTLAPI